MPNAVVEVLRQGVSELGYATQPGEVWEPSFAEKDKEGNIVAKRIDVENYKDGPACIDPTIAAVTSGLGLGFGSVQSILDKKRSTKEVHYATRDNNQRLKTTLKFYVFVVTTFGGWDYAAVKLVRELAKSKKAEPAHILDSVSITIARSVSRFVEKGVGYYQQ